MIVDSPFTSVRATNSISLKYVILTNLMRWVKGFRHASCREVSRCRKGAEFPRNPVFASV